MRNALLRGLLVVVAVTAVPAPALAADQWLPVFTRAAEQQWGGGQLPSCGQPTFEWDDLPGSEGAYADPSDCVVTLDKATWRGFTNLHRDTECIVIVHELGHLYGHEHKKLTVMDPQATSIWFLWESVNACRWVMRETRSGRFVMFPNARARWGAPLPGQEGLR